MTNMNAVTATVVLALALLACRSSSSPAGCTSNADCVNGRVCVAGACQNPPAPLPVAAPLPEPVAPTPAPAPAPPPPKPRAPAPRPGGPCTSAQEAQTRLCRCADGTSGDMVCFGRSLTWSACSCEKVAAPAPAPRPKVNPNKRWPCTADSDCNAPYKCGFQGNCMML